MSPDLKELLVLLNSHDVRYLIERVLKNVGE